MYHFIGIKGAGMSSLAVVMKKLGYEVQGSDLDKHFFTETELVKNNIPFMPYNEQNIVPGLTIIKGASITDDHIEYKKAKELNLKIITYEEMVGTLTRRFNTICVSGCHGKTTTTAMLAHVLNPIIGANYLIGDGTGDAHPDNRFFILESCEYKRHFLNYLPYYAIILNIDLDHVDYYKDIDDIRSAYEEFASKTVNTVVAWGDDPQVRKMHLDKKIIYFGLENNNDIIATNIEYLPNGTSFDVVAKGNLYGHFDLPIFAKHQLLDALATLTICYLEKLPSNEVETIFATFKGARRRFKETIVDNNVIIDDYAHHPNEVASTINAVRQKYPGKQIISIFQPHTFTRTKEFAKDLAKVLSETDEAYVMEIHPARESASDYPGITSDIIINEYENIHPIKITDASILDEYNNAVFVFMSPNDISKLEDDLIKLKSNF